MSASVAPLPRGKPEGSIRQPALGRDDPEDRAEHIFSPFPSTQAQACRDGSPCPQPKVDGKMSQRGETNLRFLNPRPRGSFKRSQGQGVFQVSQEVGVGSAGGSEVPGRKPGLGDPELVCMCLAASGMGCLSPLELLGLLTRSGWKTP